MTADGAAAVETLRAELARAKEQTRKSDAAALKAVEELRAEQAAHCQSKDEIAKMAVELKDAADRYQLLEEENRVKAMDLEKAMVANGVLDSGVLTTSSPDQLDWAEDPHGRLLMGQFGQPKTYTRKIPQDLVIKTRTPPHQRIRLGLL